MRLVQITRLLKFRHGVANRRGTQALLKSLGNCARRYWLPSLNVGPDDIRQYLSVAAFLKG
jgi:hypothetical protein